MLRHKTDSPPEYIYPAEEWRMVEKQFYPRMMAATETLFATSNGFLGIRGTFEEGTPVFQKGTYINGFHESWPIQYGEEAFGFAKTGQTMIPVTDSSVIKLYVDDEPFFLPTANLLSYERALDMRAGTLDRHVVWHTAAGKQVQIKSRRLVSFEHRHLAAISYEVTVLNTHAPIAVASEIAVMHRAETDADDPRRSRRFEHQVFCPHTHHASEMRVVLGHRVHNSHMTIACGIDHVLDTSCRYSHETECTEDSGRVVFAVEAKSGVPIRLTKYMSYHTSRSAPPEELCSRVERTLDRARKEGFDTALASQQHFLNEFWDRSGIEIDGADPSYVQAIHFNQFHICQATARAEGVGVPAKGLTGPGYEGHYFWDTEIYVLPYLIYTAPRIARNLLSFRYSMLESARKRAREVNQKGALFPWRTINGEEASAYYAAGTAQYHINADIMYALKKYVDITGDREFLLEQGAEMLVETARLWCDLGFYSNDGDRRFLINGVTGPDEYNTVVNNNAYTNLMARANLRYAVRTVEMIQTEEPDRYQVLVDRTGLKPNEVTAWKKAAERMYVPHDEQRGIHLQDDSFFDRKVWDFDNTPADKYPLLLNFHPLVIYRHQVIKQADVVLAMVLLGDEFSVEQKERNFNYYDPLTTGDSSLSACIQCIAAFEIGKRDEAGMYAAYAALMDLADFGGNVQDGVHVASMGGTWMAVVYGLAGMRDYDGELTFRPHRPRLAHRVRIPLTVRGNQLEVVIDCEHGEVTYRLREGDGLTIHHFDEKIELTVEQEVSRPLPDQDQS